MAKRNTQLSVVRTVIWIGTFSQVVISYGCKFKSLKFLDLAKNLDWCIGMGTRIYWLKKNLTKSGKIPSNGHEGRHLCYIQLWRSCNTFLGTRLLETFKGVFRKEKYSSYSVQTHKCEALSFMCGPCKLGPYKQIVFHISFYCLANRQYSFGPGFLYSDWQNLEQYWLACRSENPYC